MRLHCPCCGLRDLDEFEYGGDASVAYPDLGDGAAAWFDPVYRRDDPEGAHRELWRHARGCGLWLIVTRDTLTHDVTDVRAAHPGLAAALGGAAAEPAEDRP